MSDIRIPADYKSALTLHETQVGIKTVKDFFQNLLAARLNLLRVSAPLFVDPFPIQLKNCKHALPSFAKPIKVLSNCILRLSI